MISRSVIFNSAPASVSIEPLVHGSSAVMEAHRVATAEALAYLERHAEPNIASDELTQPGASASAPAPDLPF